MELAFNQNPTELSEKGGNHNFSRPQSSMRDEGLVALHAYPGHSSGKTNLVTQVPKTICLSLPLGIILENP